MRKKFQTAAYSFGGQFFQRQNPDFLLKNPDFPLKNVEFIIKQALT